MTDAPSLGGSNKSILVDPGPSIEKALGGRPRNPAIDTAVTAATRQLLVEVGFAGTTVQEISRRTGIHPPAIYRRWPSRIALIEDAAFGDLAALRAEVTGDLAADLLRFAQAYEANVITPVARAAMPGLLAAYGEGAATPADRWVHLSTRPVFANILSASDDVDPSLDVDVAFEVLLVTPPRPPGHSAGLASRPTSRAGRRHLPARTATTVPARSASRFRRSECGRDGRRRLEVGPGDVAGYPADQGLQAERVAVGHEVSGLRGSDDLVGALFRRERRDRRRT